MDPGLREYLPQFTAACHKVAAYGLVRCSSGNLSWQVDSEHMLISASGTWLTDIREGQVAVCRVSDGKALNDKRPSVEVRFHTGILRERADARVVLHFQSPCATTLTCCEPALIVMAKKCPGPSSGMERRRRASMSASSGCRHSWHVC